MKKIQYLIGALSLGLLISLGPSLLWKSLFPQLEAVTVPVAFSDGSVLTAGQLNSNNNTIYNAFNAHDHDGAGGEPSTLSPSAIDTKVEFQHANGFLVGPPSGSGDAEFTLRINQASANDWKIFSDNDADDALICHYNGVEEFAVFNNGGLRVTDEGTSTGVLIQNTGGTSSDAEVTLRVNNTSTNEWNIKNDNSEADNLVFNYAGSDQELAIETDGDVFVRGGISTDAQSVSSGAIAWERYTGTTGVLGSVTAIDTSTPGSGAPYYMGCSVNLSSDSWTNCSGHGEDTDGTGSCCWVEYDTSLDDTFIKIFNDAYCTNWASKSYRCLLIYAP